MNFRPSHASATSEPMPMDYARARLNMVNNQLRPNRVDDLNVLDAMAEILASGSCPRRCCAVWLMPTRICRCRTAAG